MKISEYLWKCKRSYIIINFVFFILGISMLFFSFNTTGKYWGAIGFSFGTTFSAGAIVSFLDLLRNTSQTLSVESMNNILSAGFKQVNKHRDLEEYYSIIGCAKSIDIAGYSLRGFMQSHKETIGKLSLNDGFKLRIVFVDPESEISKNREIVEEGKCKGLFETSYQSVCDILGPMHGVEIYKVNFALSTMIFRIDDVMYIGPHFVKEASKTCLTMKLDSKGWAFDEFQREFDNICTRGSQLINP
ncbi:MAG TPA: hypothetical protein VFC84_15215 [Desulfosporosinus sp.]|nr:hypothetical protein [Desulfosporosinus sp.]